MMPSLPSHQDDWDFLTWNFINPFTPYTLCHHYVGGEEGTGRNPPVHTVANPLLKNDNIEALQEMEIIYVQNDYLEEFMTRFLPRISCRFVLMTGQWLLPQLYADNPHVQQLLDDDRVHRWFSQNPVVDHPKYVAFPYGLSMASLPHYARALLSFHGEKTRNMVQLPLNRKTHPCRLVLEDLPLVPHHEFYEAMKEARFVLSPIGDRQDTYRHYECIGLGAVPIANVGPLFQKIFGTHMVVVEDTEEMIRLHQENESSLSYTKPSRDLVCTEYWKSYMQQKLLG
jgi:hypothetical protein